MLTRSKIKMEESISQIHRQEAPYYHNEQDRNLTYLFKQSQESKHPIRTSRNIYSESTPKYEGTKANIFTRNDLLKELKQQYEILKNLNVQDNYEVNSKNHEETARMRIQDDSQFSNSMISKKSSKLKQSEVRGLRQNLKNAEALHLQKKKLQIVIGNSMRKIQQLLNNQISLKKTIHQLKNQLDGKGGVHQEYEKIIKGHQKNQEQLQSELEKRKHQNQKCSQKIKDLNNKIASLETDFVLKDKQLKQGLEDHKKYRQLIKIQKDKYLNLQIKCKSLKMQLDMLQKEKDSDINRLVKQLETKEAKQKQWNITIQRLQNETRQKDRKYEELSQRKSKNNEGEDKKTYLEQLMYKSKEINENNKTLAESVNMIYAKMTELQKKNDVNLKKEIEAIKQKNDANKRNTNEMNLMVRVNELQKMMERQSKQKSRLAEDLKSLKQRKNELEDKNRMIERKFKESLQREEDLRHQIEELEGATKNFNHIQNDQVIRKKTDIHSFKDKEFQQLRQDHQNFINNLNSTFREKQNKFQAQIIQLQRQIDEGKFENQKIKRQAELSLNIHKTTHQAEIQKIVDQNSQLSQKLKESAASQSRGEQSNSFKTAQESNIKKMMDILQKKYQQDALRQKGFYEQKMVTIQNHHSTESKVLNDKLRSVSGLNEKLMNKMVAYSEIERQLLDIRRVLKQNRGINMGIDHLWEIKEAEYENINTIIDTLKG